MDIRTFLSEIGLEKYIEKLEKNEVDYELLVTTNDDELKSMLQGDLRIPVGAVRKILNYTGTLPKGSKLWSKSLCSKEELWQKEAFSEYPSIISHEYKRLFQLLEDGQTYGAFLQLKDMFEVIIKFPVLIVASQIYKKEEKSEEEKEILRGLMEKILSLGDWKAIADTILGKKYRKYIDSNIRIILKDVCKLYSEHSIASWRNDKIGHGILGFDMDEEFKNDIEEKILLIKDHFTKHHNNYIKMEFCLNTGEKQIALKGFSMARNLDFKEGSLYIKSDE